VELLASGAIGDLSTVRAALSVSVPKSDIRRRRAGSAVQIGPVA